MTAPEILVRLQKAGHSLLGLERDLRLSAGYLSRVKRGQVEPSFQLFSLLVFVEDDPDAALERIRALPRAPRSLETPDQPAVVAANAQGPHGAARELLLQLVPALKESGFRWAVAGALALELHGVPRATTDVDIVVRESDRGILRLLRDLGHEPAHFSAEHFAVLIPNAGKDDRLDVLFPRVEPLASAWRRPDTKRFRGLSLPVVDARSLALHKLMSERQLEQRDALSLIDAGVVTPASARKGLTQLARLEPPSDRWQRRHFDPARGLAALEQHLSRGAADAPH